MDHLNLKAWQEQSLRLRHTGGRHTGTGTGTQADTEPETQWCTGANLNAVTPAVIANGKMMSDSPSRESAVRGTVTGPGTTESLTPGPALPGPH